MYDRGEAGRCGACSEHMKHVMQHTAAPQHRACIPGGFLYVMSCDLGDWAVGTARARGLLRGPKGSRVGRGATPRRGDPSGAPKSVVSAGG